MDTYDMLRLSERIDNLETKIEAQEIMHESLHKTIKTLVHTMDTLEKGLKQILGAAVDHKKEELSNAVIQDDLSDRNRKNC